MSVIQAIARLLFGRKRKETEESAQIQPKCPQPEAAVTRVSAVSSIWTDEQWKEYYDAKNSRPPVRKSAPDASNKHSSKLDWTDEQWKQFWRSDSKTKRAWEARFRKQNNQAEQQKRIESPPIYGLTQDEIKDQRRAQMRFAKEQQDGLSD